MINKKGQALVMFIILIPLFLAVCALVIDIGLITYEKNKLTNIIDLSINENKDVKNYLKINDINDVKIKEENKCIKVTYYKKSLFGNIIGIKKYNISSKRCRK